MSSAVIAFSVSATFFFIFVAVGLAGYRIARGPSLADRVVALDMMTVSIVSFCGVAAIWSGDVAFLDVGLVLALVGFLATVALARYAERQKERREAERKDA